MPAERRRDEGAKEHKDERQTTRGSAESTPEKPGKDAEARPPFKGVGRKDGGAEHGTPNTREQTAATDCRALETNTQKHVHTEADAGAGHGKDTKQRYKQRFKQRRPNKRNNRTETSAEESIEAEEKC